MRKRLLPMLLAGLLGAAGPPETADRAVERAAMVLEIESLAATAGLAEARRLDRRVLAAMRAVPRHLFVPEANRASSYRGQALEIGHAQTISQPYIVALMTHLLRVEPGQRTLEVGTGSGYQAAVLAELVDEVESIEIIGPLAEGARELLERLGYGGVTVHHADGYFGLEEAAPFDVILVTAAPDHIPQPLVQQLAVGGRMIVPVGPVGGYQTLWKVTRVSEEEIRTEDLGGVRFVPLTREGQ